MTVFLMQHSINNSFSRNADQFINRYFFYVYYFVFRFKMEGDNESGYTHTGTPDPATAQQQQHQQFLGDASGAIPHFEDIETTEPFPEGVTIEHVKSFEKMYREHAEVIIVMR